MTPPDGPPILFDANRRALRLARSRRNFAQADFLHRRAAENAVASLEATLRDFPVVVDLSAQPGVFASALAESPARNRVGSARSLVVSAIPGSAPLPLEPGSVDLVVSLMSLHWANDLPGALAQIRHALKPDGLFLGTLLGAGTLKELRGALTDAELEERGGAQARVSPFADGYDGAGLLQRARFALPVTDVDRVTVTYRDPLALVRDLRGMGETNQMTGGLSTAVRGSWHILSQRFPFQAIRWPSPLAPSPASRHGEAIGRTLRHPHRIDHRRMQCRNSTGN